MQQLTDIEPTVTEKHLLTWNNEKKLVGEKYV